MKRMSDAAFFYRNAEKWDESSYYKTENKSQQPNIQ